jgi:hypothetical protein
MESVLVVAAVLACPVGMGLMMWFMARGMRRKDDAPERRAGLEDLRAEHDRLGAEIERLEGDGERSAPREPVR